MKLTQFPRIVYTPYSTPIEKLENLSNFLEGPEIFMKRDDLLGLAGGGNKTRKLEFLLADAKAKKSDTIITCGAVQSNHCRLTLAAANKERMNCYLVLEQRVPNSYDKNANGNNFLYHLLGVTGLKIVDKGTNMLEAMSDLSKELTEKGLNPYIIPGGGSNDVGGLGYVACAEEIMLQSFQMNVNFDKIVVASGSAGTHAGLLAGLLGNSNNTPVIGISVNRKSVEQRELVCQLTQKLLTKLNSSIKATLDDVIVFDEYVGDGYSLATEKMVEAVKLVARHESILMDPVYSGKAMSGLIDLARNGRIDPKEKVLFIHTGGSPALYAYTKYFQEN